jgi:Carbohydrate-selective porin, OprB family
MPNLFKTISSSRSTAVYSLVAWLGLTLAIISADAGSALAKAKPSKSVNAVAPAPDEVAAVPPTAEAEAAEPPLSELAPADRYFLMTADILAVLDNAIAPDPNASDEAVLSQATPASPTPANPANTTNNEFEVPPNIMERSPTDSAPSQPLPTAPPRSQPTAPTVPTAPSEAPDSTPTLTPSGATQRLDLGEPITTPTLRFQGSYVLQGDEDSIRGRVLGVYPLADWIQIGAVVDVTDDGDFNILEGAGIDLTELYVAAAPFHDLPNLRFVVGQIDFTSYFDRNSFAKDRSTHFFNSVFQSNPALQATTFTSRPGALFNWTITDNVEVKGAAFSSEPDLGDFAIDGFAGEVGFRLENFIIRGTYTTALDGGTRTGFNELFSIDRGNGIFGTRDGDREDAYGINAEYFIPEIGLGLFGRYGHYTNQDLEGDNTADTYSFGLNFLDLIMPDDRLGLGYGRELSNSSLRDDKTPDVIEIFYDVRVTRNLRVGVTFQALDEFSESIAGFRIRTDFDLIPRRTL